MQADHFGDILRLKKTSEALQKIHLEVKDQN